MNGVSVIICGFNSSKRIENTLVHLINQNIPSYINWEVLVIDNNSSDTTAQIAQNKLESSNLDFSVLKESNPGLSHARKKGVNSSKYNYLVFCDDDNWLNDNYISNVYNLFSNTQASILGGHGVAISDIELPKWFDQFKYCYATGEQHSSFRQKKTVYGAGIAFKKECFLVLSQINFTHLVTGRKGKKMLSGEDTELCWILYLLGFELFVPENGLEFHHCIPPNRLTYKYLYKFYFGNGYSSFFTSSYEDIILKNYKYLDFFPLWLSKRLLFQAKYFFVLLFQPNRLLGLTHWLGYSYSLFINARIVNQHTQNILNKISSLPKKI